ncbi:hypothetical protein ACSBOB_00790 [Mesorhizobium sp. ASY16-5R]|uniref:hypothetical protein n=1 Tax=Mesorhizobium sp. ASY16-5R TaxID=3445772 RepID=UPI003FA0E7A5
MIGYEVTSNVPGWAALLVTLASAWLVRALFVSPYILWRDAVAKGEADSRQLARLHAAMDRSGRSLISIREALDIVISNLSDTWPKNATRDEKRVLAAAKLREIGHENQIPIWGFEATSDLPEIFKDHRVHIPPSFWIKNRIDPVLVYARPSSPQQPIPHTTEDEEFTLDPVLQPTYGDIRIDPELLKAACPPPSR